MCLLCIIVDAFCSLRNYWNKGQPNNNGGQDCVEFRNDGWNDAKCDSWKFWICKKLATTCSSKWWPDLLYSLHSLNIPVRQWTSTHVFPSSSSLSMGMEILVLPLGLISLLSHYGARPLMSFLWCLQTPTGIAVVLLLNLTTLKLCIHWWAGYVPFIPHLSCWAQRVYITIIGIIFIILVNLSHTIWAHREAGSGIMAAL